MFAQIRAPQGRLWPHVGATPVRTSLSVPPPPSPPTTQDSMCGTACAETLTEGFLLAVFFPGRLRRLLSFSARLAMRGHADESDRHRRARRPDLCGYDRGHAPALACSWLLAPSRRISWLRPAHGHMYRCACTGLLKNIEGLLVDVLVRLGPASVQGFRAHVRFRGCCVCTRYITLLSFRSKGNAKSCNPKGGFRKSGRLRLNSPTSVRIRETRRRLEQHAEADGVGSGPLEWWVALRDGAYLQGVGDQPFTCVARCGLREAVTARISACSICQSGRGALVAGSGPQWSSTWCVQCNFA